MSRMCGWSRVGVGSIGCSQLLQGLANNTLKTPQVEILFDVTPTADSCAEAMENIAATLQNRLAAKDIVVISLSKIAYRFDIQLSSDSRDTAEVTLNVRNVCAYPIDVIWSRNLRDSTGTFSVSSIKSLMTALVKNLKR